MDNDIRDIIDRAIEKELNLHISKIGSNELTVRLLGELVDGCYKAGDLAMGERLRPALEILIPRMLITPLSDESKPSPNLHELIFEACLFAIDYYDVRDLIYISYSDENEIIWNENNGIYQISIKDNSIARQFSAEFQTFLLNSSQIKENFFYVVDKLSKIKQFDADNPDLIEIFESIKREAEWKIRYFFFVHSRK